MVKDVTGVKHYTRLGHYIIQNILVNLRIEFRPRNPNVPEWTTIILATLDTVINPPLFMPCPIV